MAEQELSTASYWRHVSSGIPPFANWKAPSAEPPSHEPATLVPLKQQGERERKTGKKAQKKTNRIEKA
jgi:hypothetical protein